MTVQERNPDKPDELRTIEVVQLEVAEPDTGAVHVFQMRREGWDELVARANGILVARNGDVRE